MNTIMHVVKFLGLLLAISLMAQYMPYGCAMASAVLLVGLWKLSE